jgi:fused signal recognition particle receptor
MSWTPEILIAAGGSAALLVGLLVFVQLRRRRAVQPTVEEPAAAVPAPTLRESLTKTRQGFLSRLQSAWGPGKDAEARIAELEEVLLTADVGLKVTQALLAKLRPRARELTDVDALRRVLRDEMEAILASGGQQASDAKPRVVLVAGVNGVGKTTTIGKLAYLYREAGQKVLLVAADTFRAAASEQLQRWAERVGVGCVHHQSGADPSAVAYDGLKAAVARGVDVVIVDTAGRLHVKAHLIEELKKIVRVIGKEMPGAPHEALLVIDATTGQNAINQARVFCEALPLTGIVLTKLDGTAKGGAVLAIRGELGIPIRYVGFGETLPALAPFDAAAFVDALLETSEPPRGMTANERN